MLDWAISSVRDVVSNHRIRILILRDPKRKRIILDMNGLVRMFDFDGETATGPPGGWKQKFESELARLEDEYRAGLEAKS